MAIRASATIWYRRHRCLSPEPFRTQANSRYRQSGPSVSNTHDFASVSVPAALTRDPTRKSPHWACTQLAQRENLQKSAAKVPRNTTPKLRPSADRVSKAIDLNTRSLVRLVSPQAGGLIDRLLIEHDRALARRRNGSEVPAINEYASKLMLETAFKELKVPICRLSTIGRALKDFYTQSGISDEAKRSEPLLLNIKDLLDRIEQTLLLFADIDQIELALAGLRLKRVGLGNTDPKGNADPKGNCDPKGNAEPKGNADPNPAQGQSRQSHAYIGRSFTQLGPDTPPPGRGLLHLPDEID